MYTNDIENQKNDNISKYTRNIDIFKSKRNVLERNPSAAAVCSVNTEKQNKYDI